ncbi:MAG: TatD family hydrolase [Lachnospiraceae bacterium]|nr:TatD family hydrolase [Lachnospiraceae bacterium]
MIFETHAHYEDEQFDEDRKELLKALAENGIDYVINVSTSLDTAKQCIKLADDYDYIYASVGNHPDYVEELDDEAIEQIRGWCHLPKVVAIGEIGLDYHWEPYDKELQKKAFCMQMQLASEEDMPVIIHSRDAAKDTFDIIKEFSSKGVKGIVHCYGYSLEYAKEFVKMGYKIGVGGVLTFKNARRLVETCEGISLDDIVLETDSPYMAPTPNRGKRNSSLNIPYIAQKLAEIKNVSVEEVYEATMNSAKEIYRL